MLYDNVRAREVSAVLFRLGLVAIVLSFLPLLAIAAAPLLGLSLGASAGLAVGLAATGELLFWGGLALAGKDTWHTVRTRGWRRAPRELWRLLRHGRPATAALAAGRAGAAPVDTPPADTGPDPVAGAEPDPRPGAEPGPPPSRAA